MKRLAQLSSELITDKSAIQNNHPSQKPEPIGQFGEFQICFLEQRHRDEVLELCVREFTNNYPLMQAFIRAYPHRHFQFAYYRFWNRIIDQFIGNKLSIVALHKPTNRVAAAVLAIDYLQTFSERFTQDLTEETWSLCAYEALRCSLLPLLAPEVEALLNTKGLVAEGFVAVSDEKFSSQKIVVYLMSLSPGLMKSQGYHYAFAFPTNCITKHITEKVGGKKIAECRADTFEFQGQRPFKEIENQNNYPAFYLKPLNDVPNL